MRAKEFIVEVQPWGALQKVKNWATQRFHPSVQSRTAAYSRGMQQAADERMQNELINQLSQTLPRIASSGQPADIESYLRDYINRYISAYTVPTSLKPTFENILKQIVNAVGTSGKVDQNAVAQIKNLSNWIIDVEQAQVRDPRTQQIKKGAAQPQTGPRAATYGNPKTDVPQFDIRGTDYKFSNVDKKWYNIDVTPPQEIQDPEDINALNKAYYDSIKTTAAQTAPAPAPAPAPAAAPAPAQTAPAPAQSAAAPRAAGARARAARVARRRE